MKKLNPGDQVRTPRFLTVTIKEVFPSETAMREAGYTEPTHYDDPECKYRVSGKSIGENLMEFAAAPRIV